MFLIKEIEKEKELFLTGVPCVCGTVCFHAFPSVPVMEKWVDTDLPAVYMIHNLSKEGQGEKCVPFCQFLVLFWCCLTWDTFNDDTLIC